MEKGRVTKTNVRCSGGGGGGDGGGGSTCKTNRYEQGASKIGNFKRTYFLNVPKPIYFIENNTQKFCVSQSFVRNNIKQKVFV